MKQFFQKMRDRARARQAERLAYERALWDYRTTMAARVAVAVGVGIAAALTAWENSK